MIPSNNGALDRRAFVKDAALAAAAATGLTGGLGALSGLLAQPRASASWSRRVVATGQSRPFTMICLGDSVMWGQGLEESTKFTWLVKQWLERNLPGRTVNRFVYARSGATIAPDPSAPESAVQAWMNNRNYSEVPCSWPWVQRQVVVAHDDMVSQQISLDAVDLVLVDGGINDINIKTFLNATKSPEEIRSLSAQYCGTEMSDVLSRVRNTFPKAKILVTGYFPMISQQTDLQALGVLLSILLSPIGAAVTQEIQTKLVALSDAWYAASNADLGQAVDSFNARWAGVSNPASKTLPAAFANIPWGGEHSYGAPSRWLYLAGAPNDPVYNQRLSACAAAGAGYAGSPFCLDAKIGHPNTSGAAAYAQACQDKLRPYLLEWGGAKPMIACVEMDPMPAVGVATTLTVHATADGPTGRMTVPGTVHVGGQTFPTDTPVPLTLCTNKAVPNTIDREGRKLARQEKLGTAVSCTPLTVTAQGYLDVVISDYLKAQPLP